MLQGAFSAASKKAPTAVLLRICLICYIVFYYTSFWQQCLSLAWNLSWGGLVWHGKAKELPSHSLFYENNNRKDKSDTSQPLLHNMCPSSKERIPQ